MLAVSKLDGMPSESTIRTWGRDPKNADADFVANYARAREEGAYHQFDQIKDLEERILLPKDDPQRIDPNAGRVAIDSMKWRLSKMLPRAFGDRLGLDHTGNLSTALPTAKEHAPEWMQERLAGDAAKLEASQEVDSPDGVVH